jgi:hypothetical protein
MVDLPDAEAARVFANAEPNYLAGVYREVMVRNVLGRTMWDFPGDPANGQRFPVIGHGRPGVTAAGAALGDEHQRYFAGHDDRLIARGRCCPMTALNGLGARCSSRWPARRPSKP